MSWRRYTISTNAPALITSYQITRSSLQIDIILHHHWHCVTVTTLVIVRYTPEYNIYHYIYLVYNYRERQQQFITTPTCTPNFVANSTRHLITCPHPHHILHVPSSSMQLSTALASCWVCRSSQVHIGTPARYTLHSIIYSWKYIATQKLEICKKKIYKYEFSREAELRRL